MRNDIFYWLCSANGFGITRIFFGRLRRGWAFGLRLYPQDSGLPSSIGEWKALLQRSDRFLERTNPNPGLYLPHRQRPGENRNGINLLVDFGRENSSFWFDEPPPGGGQWSNYYNRYQGERDGTLVRQRIGTSGCTAHGPGPVDIFTEGFIGWDYRTNP